MSNSSWSQVNRIGLGLTIALGLLNVVLTLVNLPRLLNNADGQDGPPNGILIVVGVLGAVMVVAGALAWMTVSRRSATVASVAAILQGLTTLPAFGRAPLLWQLVAGAVLVWTVLAVGLTLTKSRRSAPVE